MIDITQLRQMLKTGPDQDGLVQLNADAAISLWESETRELWAARTGVVKVITPEDRDTVFWLYARNVSSLVLDEGDDHVVMAADTYSLASANGRVTRLRSDQWSLPIRATFSCGYTSVTVPADVRMAVMYQAAFMQSRMSSAKIDVTSQSLGKGSAALLDPELHPFFKRQVDKYRKR